jgi:hypothetical protein
MYRFTRTAMPRTASHVPAALQMSAEVTAHMNRTYGVNMKAGIELFGRGRLHWHYEAETLDRISEVNRKLMGDTAYWALLEKYKSIWLEGSMKDTVISLTA